MLQVFYRRKPKFIIVMVLVIIAATLLVTPRKTAAADEFNYSVNSIYRVTSSPSMRVEETYTVKNNSDNRYLDSIKISTPVDDAKNISVEYSDGVAIPFTVEKKKSDEKGYNYEYVEVSVQFSRQNVGQNNRWGFIVSYDTDKLVENKGNAHTVSVPGVPQDDGNTFSAELYVPQDFGPIFTTGVLPKSLGASRGQAGYRFENKSELAKSASLIFGDSTIYEVEFKYPLKNPSAFGSTFTITLPPTTSGQKVFLQKLDPQPKSTKLDSEGNIIAEYDLAARSNLEVKATVAAQVNYIQYDLSKSGTLDQIPKEIKDKYTKADGFWPSNNPTIAKKAQELTAGKKTVAEQVKAINDYVVSQLTYDTEKIKYNIRQGGQKALENPDNAVCLEYSDLSISLMRAAGIPARMPVGYGYSGSLKQSSSVSDSLHSWVQAYVPGVGWMNLDPTWGEKFDNFGTSDLDHFAFAIWGENDSMPAAVMQNGNDTNYQYENTTIAYKTTAVKLNSDAKLNAKKWLLAPFIALTRLQAQAPSTNAGEDYFVRTRQGGKIEFVELGSLAPQQKKSHLLLSFGGVAFGSLQADFSQNGPQGKVLATQSISAQTWPCIVLLIIIAGVIVTIVVKSKLTRDKRSKQKLAQPIPTILDLSDKQSDEQTPKK